MLVDTFGVCEIVPLSAVAVRDPIDAAAASEMFPVPDAFKIRSKLPLIVALASKEIEEALSVVIVELPVNVTGALKLMLPAAPVVVMLAATE